MLGSSMAAAGVMLSRFLSDHTLQKYIDKLQAAVLHTVPVLFMGGSTDDYEAVTLKRMATATGVKLHLYLWTHLAA